MGNEPKYTESSTSDFRAICHCQRQMSINSTSSSSRLSLLTSHLQPLSHQSSDSQPRIVLNLAMSNAARPPITCHVLDTTTGRPAANLAVKLSCVAVPSIEFVGITNNDGRIAAWENKQGSEEGAYVESKGGVIPALLAMIVLRGHLARVSGSCNSILEHITESGILSFLSSHFHFPLLLGPYSFTTYRGS